MYGVRVFTVVARSIVPLSDTHSTYRPVSSRSCHSQGNDDAVNYDSNHNINQRSATADISSESFTHTNSLTRMEETLLAMADSVLDASFSMLRSQTNTNFHDGYSAVEQISKEPTHPKFTKRIPHQVVLYVEYEDFNHVSYSLAIHRFHMQNSLSILLISREKQNCFT